MCVPLGKHYKIIKENKKKINIMRMDNGECIS